MRNTYLRCALLALAAITTMPAADPAPDTSLCWKDTKTRGAGVILKGCQDGYTYENGLCYPTCPAGYRGEGPLCWRECPAGWTDMGSCRKPTALTCQGHGWQGGDKPTVGFPGWDEGAKRRCKSEHGADCVQQGQLFYAACPAGTARTVVTTCEAVCPAGMRDDGLFCAKDTIARGAGKIPSCRPGEEQQGALCYPQCGTGYKGVGPVCWGTCSGDYSYDCGAACAKSQGSCVAAIANMATTTASVALSAAAIAFPGASAAFKEALNHGSSAASQSILAGVQASGERALMLAVKDYAVFAAKGLAKKYLVKNGARAMREVYAELKDSGLEAINKSSGDLAILQDAKTFDLAYLTAFDPTGVSSMVMAYAKFGRCTPSTQFSLSRSSIDFGPTNGITRIMDTYLTARRTTKVTAIATPAFKDASINLVTDCVGRTLSTGQTCRITAQVSTFAKLDTELRIYTDLYSLIPFPVTLTANPYNAEAALIKEADEFMNSTHVQGVWSPNGIQANKNTIDANGNGRSHLNELFTIAPQPGGSLGRAFTVRSGSWVYTFNLNTAGDRLTYMEDGVELPLTLQNGMVLDVFYALMNDGAQVVQHQWNGGDNQKFRLEQLPDGTWRIKAKHSGLYLTIDEAAFGPGLRQAAWRDSVTQRFRIEPVGMNQSFRIVHVATGDSLTVKDDSRDIAAPIVLGPWQDAAGQRFGSLPMQTWLRRPWDDGCAAGETSASGKCYDVPPGWEVVSNGFIGKLCPTGWKDDGSTCRAPWTGVLVPGVADRDDDPNVGTDLLYPAVVRTCNSYSQVQGQNCPANWVRTGPCECSPTITSKQVTPLAGH